MIRFYQNITIYATIYGYINNLEYEYNVGRGVGKMFKIDNEFKNANISRTIRFTDSLFEKLNETAHKNDISFNLLVLQCCKYALENQQLDDDLSK